MSRTIVQLPLSATAYAEIAEKLRLVGYDDALMSNGNLDLTCVTAAPLDETGRAWERSLGYAPPRCAACGCHHLGRCDAMEARELRMEIALCPRTHKTCVTPEGCMAFGCSDAEMRSK